MDLILAPVKVQSKDLNVVLVFQLLLRARGRNHLTPLSTALSTPGSRSNVVTSSRTQHFVLLRYNFVTSFNFLSTAQPRGDEMNRTQKSYARCLSYPIPQRSGSLTARKRAMKVLSPIFFPHSHTWACS